MRRDATASKCFVQLVGNRKLAGEKALERPSLTASELNFISKLCRITGPGPDRLSIPCFSRNAQVVYLRFCFCRLRHARGLLAWPRKPAWFWNRRVGGSAIGPDKGPGAGGSAIGPDKGPGAGGMAVERMAVHAAKAKNAELEMS